MHLHNELKIGSGRGLPRLIYLRSLFFLSLCGAGASILRVDLQRVGRRRLSALLLRVLEQEAPFKANPEQLVSRGDVALDGTNFSLSRPAVTDVLCTVKIASQVFAWEEVAGL